MNNLKICILGSYSERLDEGMTNISFHLFENIKTKFSNSIMLNLKDVYSIKFWKTLLSFKPNIVHYVPGPTIKGLILLKLIQKLTGCKSIISATRPVIPKSTKRMASLMKSDLILIQSKKSENFFNELKFKTAFIPNGVEIDRFVPIDEDKKNQLRKKYGFQKEDFIVLHIGPITKARNQQTLIEISNARILLVESLTNASDISEKAKMNRNNVTIWTKYIKNIEEVYQLADVYVFPGFGALNSIELPLSVFEAMSCNLPVISTRHGGLERIFEEGNGLFFIDKSQEIKEHIQEIKDKKITIQTRKKVEQFSWEKVTNDIIKFYKDIYTSTNTKI